VCIVACKYCEAKSKFQQQRHYRESGHDQRNVMQLVGGAFSSHYSKEAVNQRNYESARQELDSLSAKEGDRQCMGFLMPDLGSNHGTCWYNFWALLWERL
jgi:hypothetical protein